jgi:hypothetical protein
MDYKFLYHKITGIIMNPYKAWEAISNENGSIKNVRYSFFFPLIILVALSALLGSLIFINSSLSPVYSVLVGIKYFILFYLVIYGSAMVFSEITKALDLGKDFMLSFKMMNYSIAPFLLCQIMSRLFESLIFINILGLYGLYIFWLGAEKMLNPPEHKKMPMLVATFIVVTGLFIGINFFLTIIIDRLYFSIFA